MPAAAVWPVVGALGGSAISALGNRGAQKAQERATQQALEFERERERRRQYEWGTQRSDLNRRYNAWNTQRRNMSNAYAGMNLGNMWR